jgi:hypothetical protein
MKSYRSFALTVVTRCCHPIACSLALCFLFSSPAFGQQAQAKKRVPVLTTDDVVRERPQVEVVEGARAGAEGKKAGDTDKPAATAAGTKAGAGDKADPAEAAWRDRVEKARAKAKAAQRTAEEGELRVNELRNRLGNSGGTPKDRNQTAAELEQMGQRLKEMRAEARAAEAELQEALGQAKGKGFTEAEGPKPVADGGGPNEDYYKTRFAKLNEAVQDAERGMQLYDLRVRDLRSRLTNNSADRFSTGQVQEELEAAQQKLDQARNARTKAQSDLDALLDEARRAGVSPGVFR